MPEPEKEKKCKAVKKVADAVEQFIYSLRATNDVASKMVSEGFDEKDFELVKHALVDIEKLKISIEKSLENCARKDDLDLNKYFAWMEKNVIDQGLVPVNPATARSLVEEFPELGKTSKEKMFYAEQIVNKFIEKRKKEP